MKNWRTHAAFPDVQSALDVCMEEEPLDATVDCITCASRQAVARKVRQIEEPPRVLLVEMRCWVNVMRGGQFVGLRREMHGMRLNEEVLVVPAGWRA